jgi:two-component system CitB family sensor kinase
VVIVDPRGRLLLVNDEARRLAGLPSDAVERSAEDVVGPGRLADLLVGRVDGADQILVRDEHVIVANRRAVVRDGRELGAIVTLRDRTELEALLRELDSVRGLTDAMRAQAHEFSNRLHTLAGLLALGHHEAAREFIAEVTEADTELRRDLVERIADEHVAALLLAKWAVAAERGVELRLAPDARLDSELVDAREALTVLGNLVDNALDAASAGARRPGLVEVFLGEEGSALVVRVRDSGPGVAPAKRDRVFEPGYSTKPGEGRGVGLSLVDQLVERRGGRIEVGDANDEDGGAVFTVWLPESVRGAQVVTL